jgi:hypothetical protein
VSSANSGSALAVGSSSPRHRNSRSAAALLAGMAIITVHFVAVTRPLLGRYHGAWCSHPMPDDAYYYFQPAWNAAHGHGLTLDGFSPTNGFHPLWMMVLVAAARFSASKEALLENWACLSSVCFYLSAVLFALSVRAIFRSPIAALATLALYLAIPHVLAQHMNGLETGLVLLLTSASLCVLLSEGVASSGARLPAVVLLGTLSGLLFLARTDMVFAVGAMWVLGALPVLRPRPGVGPRARRRVAHLCALTGPTIALAGPWLVWNLRRFGMAVQASAYVFPCIERAYGRAYLGETPTGWHHSQSPALWSKFADAMEWHTTGLPVLVWAVIVGASACVATRMSGRMRARYTTALAVLLASFLSLACVHTLLRLSPRPWYFVQAQLLLVLALVGIFAGVIGGPKSVLRGILAAVLIVAVVAHVNRRFRSQEFRPRATTLAGAERPGTMRSRLPEGVRVVGHTDAGRLAYFAPDSLTVVNLDGLINNPAASALREGRLADYILSSPVEYVIMRPQIGLLESLMGSGYRRHFRWVGMRGGFAHAWPVRDQHKVLRHLHLPPDGVVSPSRPDHWHYLLGEWRFAWATESGPTVNVQGCGVQFALERGGDYRFEVTLASPCASVPLASDVLVDGRPARHIGRSDATPCAFSVSAGRLTPGLHTIVLPNREQPSRRTIGPGDNAAVRTYVVRSFQLTPETSDS